MTESDPLAAPRIAVSLVDGDTAVRHTRQLMLHARQYDVRSYATGAILLADPRSRDCPCIVLDGDVDGVDATALLDELRATGWRGRALVLKDIDHAGMVDRHGNRVLPRTIGDNMLVAAIGESIDRGWSSWNAR